MSNFHCEPPRGARDLRHSHKRSSEQQEYALKISAKSKGASSKHTHKLDYFIDKKIIYYTSVFDVLLKIGK